jgi:hypothetical protein
VPCECAAVSSTRFAAFAVIPSTSRRARPRSLSIATASASVSAAASNARAASSSADTAERTLSNTTHRPDRGGETSKPAP